MTSYHYRFTGVYDMFQIRLNVFLARIITYTNNVFRGHWDFKVLKNSYQVLMRKPSGRMLFFIVSS